MLITSNFVYLNFPRTGSNFCRDSIKTLYKKRQTHSPFMQLLKYGTLKNSCEELMLFDKEVGINNQHAPYQKIPKYSQHKTILGSIRCPKARFKSMYNLKWWQHPYPNFDIEKLLSKYKTTNPLSIEDYIDLIEALKKSELKKRGISQNITMGKQTIEFIIMFFKNPDDVLKHITPSYIHNKEYLNDIAPIHFIQQEYLNEGLARFLRQQGFTKKEVDFVRTHHKINATSKPVLKQNEHILTPKVIDYIKDTEWMLFDMLEELGFNYKD